MQSPRVVSVAQIEQRTEPVVCVRCVAAASRGAGCPSPNYWSWRRQPDRLTKRQGQKWYCLAIPTVPFRGFALLPPKHNPLLLYYGCSLQRSNVLLGRCIKTTHSSLKAKEKRPTVSITYSHEARAGSKKNIMPHPHLFAATAIWPRIYYMYVQGSVYTCTSHNFRLCACVLHALETNGE